MSDDKHWRSYPFLSALRPEPGETIDGAILSTYSADLVVVVAAMLALAGLDDDRGSGSKVDFANSFERLKGKFTVLCQRGRIQAPSRSASVLNLMDHFVREVTVDEHFGAWHPKVALMKYLRDDGSTSWRFWLGSRNLTRSIAWQAGLAIASDASAGQHIEGIAAAGELLAQHARLDGWEPSRTRRELERLRWCVPQGIELAELRLWDVGEDRPLPKEPDGVQRVIVVSPYLNGSVIRQLGSWGGRGAKRTLVSTLPELRKLSLQVNKPLAKFKGELAYFESPVEEEPERDAGTADGEGGMTGAEDPAGRRGFSFVSPGSCSDTRPSAKGRAAWHRSVNLFFASTL